MIGCKRVEESKRAQLQARGVEEPCPEESLREIKFPPWQLEFYGDSQLSSSEWAERSCLENLAATQGIGNHTCIPEVCHKGAVGRQGFCRMKYWFWAWVSRTGESLWKRFHGKRLIPRWASNDSEQPPIDCVPPNVGIAQSEQTHPFVTKSSPKYVWRTALQSPRQCTRAMSIRHQAASLLQDHRSRFRGRCRR